LFRQGIYVFVTVRKEEKDVWFKTPQKAKGKDGIGTVFPVSL
jgi:hypothetical protein